MTTPSFVIVLEYWLQVDSSNINGFSVFLNNLLDVIFVTIASLEIFASSQECVILSNWLYSCDRCLLNTGRRECLIYVGTKSYVVEEFFWVVGFIFMG